MLTVRINSLKFVTEKVGEVFFSDFFVMLDFIGYNL